VHRFPFSPTPICSILSLCHFFQSHTYSRLTPLTSSVTISSVSLYPSSLAVSVQVAFSVRSLGAAHALTTSSVWFLMCLGVPFSLQLFVTSLLHLCSVRDIISMRRQIHISKFKCFKPFYVTLLQCPYLASEYSTIYSRQTL